MIATGERTSVQTAAGRINNLITLSTADTAKFEIEWRALVSDPYSANLEEEVRAVLNNDDGRLYATRLLQALNLFLFVMTAERSQSPILGEGENKARTKEADQFLRTEKAYELLYEFYEVPEEYQSDEIYLHRTGTTSYIFKVKRKRDNSGYFALKCIKPYLTKYESIGESTRNYYHQFPRGISKYTAAQVGDLYSDHFIVMSFIEGPTLREYCASDIWPAEPAEKLRMIKGIVTKLCDALSYYASNGVAHLDLSPDNIIREPEEDGGEKVYLIDFGYNHILKERVASNSVIHRNQIYMAHELSALVSEKDQGKITMARKVKADIYSLAMIVVESVYGEINLAANVYPALNAVRKSYTHLARLLDSLLDDKPTRRLMEIGSDKPEDYYKALKKSLIYCLDVQREALLRNEYAVTKVTRVLDALATSALLPCMERHHAVRALQSIQVGGWGESGAKLLKWQWLAVGLHFTIVSLFIGYVMTDWRNGMVLRNMPGRIICFSFSHVAVRYYVNLFGMVSAKGVSTWVEQIIRYNSWAFSLSIFWTMIVEPKHWPICSAIGLLFIGMNNWSNNRLVNKVLQHNREDYPKWIQSSFDQLESQFSGWAFMVMMYAGLLVTIQVLLGRSMLQDEWAYMALAVFMNYRMYFVNCTKLAHTVGGGIERLYWWQRRKPSYAPFVDAEWDVFLCVGHKDYPMAEKLQCDLQEQGMTVFLAPTNLADQGEAEWPNAVNNALIKAKNMIVVCSSPTNLSKRCAYEYQRFIGEIHNNRKNEGKIVLVVKKIIPDGSLPIDIRLSQQYIYTDQNIAKIVTMINNGHKSA